MSRGQVDLAWLNLNSVHTPGLGPTVSVSVEFLISTGGLDHESD